jgi:nitrogenase molybdenum-iron protein alpha/beta subunit
VAVNPETLPESYKKLRERDETFWVDQERNIQGALGQPCCTLSGISAGFIKMRGNFAVVIHGEDECGACFRHLGPNKINFYVVGLTEKEFVSGRTAEPLKKCLRLVAEETMPEAIFVLGACPVEVIGDQFQESVAEVQKEFPDVPMLALHTSGLKVGSQQAMLDWMFESLAALPVIPPSDRLWRRTAAIAGQVVMRAAASGTPEEIVASIQAMQVTAKQTHLDPEWALNFIGIPRNRAQTMDVPEAFRVCMEVGITPIANYPEGSTFRDWRAIRFAKASFVADRSLYPKLVDILVNSGKVVEEIPLPIGLRQTKQMYDTIGRVFGVEAQIAAAYAPLLEAAERRLEAFRARWGRLSIAYGIRMLNNYEADQLAYSGLGDHMALEEFGFDVTLLVQGPPDKRDRFEKMFERRGITLPFDMFIEPWVMAEVLQRGGYQVAYLADHCRPEAQKAGVPMIPSRGLKPFFQGAIENIDYLDHTLTHLLAPHTFAPHQTPESAPHNVEAK